MKIVFDTDKNELKLGNKVFGVDLSKEKEDLVINELKHFLKTNTMIDDYDEDSMWMSYRYCVGRSTIAAHMRANDIKNHCYGRMTRERTLFTAYDINKEIENKMSYGCGPNFWFPVSSINRVYTSAIDIFCQFVEDYNIQSKNDLLKYKDVYIRLYDNERGYTLETVTWEEYLRPKVYEIVRSYHKTDEDSAWECFKNYRNNLLENKEIISIECPIDCTEKFDKLIKEMPNPHIFYLTHIDDLMTWNNLVHVFDVDKHHKSVLVDGSEVEWYWTYIHDTYQKEDGHYYRKEIGYKKVRVPIDSPIGDNVSYIPDDAIINDIY